MHLLLRTDRRYLPPEAVSRKLRVDIHAPGPENLRSRPPIRLGLVLDRSASMAGSKLELTLKAALNALRTLRPTDGFCLVTYNDGVTIECQLSVASPAALAHAESAIGKTMAAGNTNLSGGWLTGCAELGAGLSEGTVARCFLLTDGLANKGITQVTELERHARELRRRGVTTSTLGVGADFDERLLRSLADAGGGRFYFASESTKVAEIFATEVGDALTVVARDVLLRVRAGNGVRITSVNGDPSEAEGDVAVFDIGSLTAGQVCTRVLTLDFPGGALGTSESVEVSVADRDGVLGSARGETSWRRIAASDCALEVPEAEVTREAASLQAARATDRALELHVKGEMQQAASLLVEEAKRLREESAGDPAIAAMADRLTEDSTQYSNLMQPIFVKKRFYEGYELLKGRKVRAVTPSSGTSVPSPVPRRTLVMRSVDPILARDVLDAHAALRSDAAAFGIDLVAETHPATRSPESLCLSLLEERALVEAIAKAPFTTIAVTASGHWDNWYSHWHPDHRVALVSLFGWGAMSRVRPSAMIAYETILHGLRVVSDSYEPANLLHAETRGCLFDLCAQKPDVEIKLQAGHVCDECRRKLASYRISEPLVARLWSAVLQLAHSPPTNAVS